MADLKYCICCGDDVPYHTVERDERQEIICSNCGFPLEVTEQWKESEKPNVIAFVAEDSEAVRKIIVEMLEKKNFVQEVIPCKNGAELLREITDHYKKKSMDEKHIKTGFAIIDLNMPVMDGVTAARSIRSFEEKNIIDKIPIVFFSSIIANEKIRNLLNALSPAVYVNKGKDPDIETLTRRVDTLLKYVGEKFIQGVA